MRTIFGFLLGVIVTISGAYMHDTQLPEASSQRLVNWNQAKDLSRTGVEWARHEWDKLTAR